MTSSVERDVKFPLLKASPQRELVTRGRETHRKHKRVRTLRPEAEVKARLLGAGPRGFVLYPGFTFTRALEGVNRLLLGNARGRRRCQGNYSQYEAIHNSYNDK